MKSYNLCMILMCRASPQKNNMGAYVVRTFLGLVKIIQNLYDDYVKIARNCMILMVADIPMSKSYKLCMMKYL